MTRRRGFTLIELLVVIAIIGILAAMLFPVFARARESARKTQCLANVKNIATAINMYLVDWDKFFPLAVDRGAAEWFRNWALNDRPTPRTEAQVPPWPFVCNHVRQANPYLREPVILDDYVKNRDVWKCPSARLMNGARCIVPAGRDGLWYNGFADHPNWYTDWTVAPCYVCWPTGWGGDITDGFLQGMATVQNSEAGLGGRTTAGVFMAGVGINDNMHWDSPSRVNDSARYISCGDVGGAYNLWSATLAAYPDMCLGMNTCGLTGSSYCPEACIADWTNCSWSRDCGLDESHKLQFIRDAAYRKTKARHLGGVNIGFLDGHAKWFMADVLITGQQPFPNAQFEGGMCACWPGNGEFAASGPI